MWSAARANNAYLLSQALSSLSCVRVPLPPSDLTHAWYKFYAYVEPKALSEGWSRDRILSEISLKGYPALSGSCGEIYLERCFKDAGYAPSVRLPVARYLGETSLMFLVHPTITSSQMYSYIDCIVSILKSASR